jgi:hypothetical protein
MEQVLLRPGPKASYHMSELGPRQFEYLGSSFRRIDFEVGPGARQSQHVVSPPDLALPCRVSR